MPRTRHWDNLMYYTVFLLNSRHENITIALASPNFLVLRAHSIPILCVHSIPIYSMQIHVHVTALAEN